MSHNNNTALIEEANEYLNDGSVSSTFLEELLRADLENDDMESLWRHIVQVREMLRDE